jgi:multidrug efflux pump subunit AcrA (membrane-fusion protein)
LTAISEPLPRRRRGRPVLTAVLAVVAAASVGGAAATLGGDRAVATTTSRTVTVKRGVVQETVSGSGNLAAVTQNTLSFDAAGEITKVYVGAGDKVTKGEALARLQPTDTTQDVTWIRAPYDGTVASIDYAVGDTVNPVATDAAGIELGKLARYDLSVSLSEADSGKVEAGQLATVTISATGEQLAAKVIDVGVLSSATTTDSTTTQQSTSAVSYPVTLRLTQKGKGIKPGMTASADIVTAQSTGLTVPTQALRGSTVTLADGTTRRVTTGVAGDSVTEITSGLSAGDKVTVTSTSAAAGASSTPAQSTQQRANGFGGGGMPAGGPPAGGGFGR